MRLETERLELVRETIAGCRERVAALPEEFRAMLSPEWLKLLDEATSEDDWVLGFAVQRREDGAELGSCGFKGPPDADGAVEIAYQIEAPHEGKGYATEAARALTEYALGREGVRLVRAHTLREPNASTSVLSKCGFRQTGDYDDPDDGFVWRWECTAPS